MHSYDHDRRGRGCGAGRPLRLRTAPNRYVGAHRAHPTPQIRQFPASLAGADRPGSSHIPEPSPRGAGGAPRLGSGATASTPRMEDACLSRAAMCIRATPMARLLCSADLRASRFDETRGCVGLHRHPPRRDGIRRLCPSQRNRRTTRGRGRITPDCRPPVE